jgi:hypothetical protein
MPEKRETIEEVARREAATERERAEARAEQLQYAEKLSKEVPEAFFELCGLLRENVRRFNSAADPQKRLVWRESPALAAREPNLHADFNCGFGRGHAEVNMALNAMGRSGKPDVFVMEGTGNLHEARFLLRVEGFIKQAQVQYRVTVDFKRIEVTFEELAERLVLCVVKDSFGELIRQ